MKQAYTVNKAHALNMPRFVSGPLRAMMPSTRALFPTCPFAAVANFECPPQSKISAWHLISTTIFSFGSATTCMHVLAGALVRSGQILFHSAFIAP